jgi:hypothetical protein
LAQPIEKKKGENLLFACRRIEGFGSPRNPAFRTGKRLMTGNGIKPMETMAKRR